MKATRRMSTTSRTVICRRIDKTSANTSGPFRLEEDLGRADRPGDRADVVDPQDVGAALDREHGRGDGALEPFRRRQAEDPAQEGLAREAEQQGTAEATERLRAAQDLEVVVEGLAEADAGVDDDPLRRNAGGARSADPLVEEGRDLAHEVIVMRGVLHGQGGA